MRIVHRSGKKHVNADALSRDIADSCQSYSSQIQLRDLPCGGCKFCRRAHERWHDFSTDIDDVIPLAQMFAEGSTADEGNASGMKPLGPQIRELLASGPFDPLDQSQVNVDFPSIELVVMKGSSGSSIEISTFGEDKSVSQLGKAKRSKSTEEDSNQAAGEGISLSSYSAEDMVRLQSSDKVLNFLRAYLESGVLPSESELMTSSLEEKCYVLERDCFMLDDRGVIWRKPAEDKDALRLLVPKALREEVMYLCDDIPSSGHQGIQRSKERLKPIFYWWRMVADMKNYVLTCDVCCKNKRCPLPNRSALKSYQAGSLMEKVHLDFLGALPRTENGNEYILMMVDSFTKWVECVLLPSQTAEVTARAAINEFFARFGYPYEVFTDQGWNFESELFRKKCEILWIHKTRTTPYRPSGNGQVERYNRTLMDAVRCYIDGRPKSWDQYLAPLAGALRSAINRRTGYTANKLMLGREVNVPATILYRPPDSNDFQNGEEGEVDKYVRDLQ